MEFFGRLTILGKSLLIVAILGVLTGGTMMAASALSITRTVEGRGNITVQPAATNPDFDFTVGAIAYLDFGGSVAVAGNTYTKTVDCSVTNTGTDGTNGGAPATINTITASLANTPQGWPAGATITGSRGSLIVGASGTVPVTLTIPNVSSNITLPNFTINLTAS